MGTIADLIFSQMQTAGKPRTTTQRTTGTVKATENAPLDLGSLGLLLYMMLSGRNKTSLGTTAAPAATNLTSLINQAPATLTQQSPAASSSAALQQVINSLMGSSGTFPASTSTYQQNPIELLLRMFGQGGTRGL